MAVDFPSDLVLDVARAADPARAGEVAGRLSKVSAPGGAASASGVGRLSRAHDSSDPQGAAKEFEALLVGDMVSDMMGDAEESYFGGGFAGGVWKSMMAEQIAMAVVQRADFGVASTISGYFVRNGETVEPVGGISDAASAPLETRAEDAARSTTHELNRDFVRKLMALDTADGGR